jgi:hypothetical protein
MLIDLASEVGHDVYFEEGQLYWGPPLKRRLKFKVDYSRMRDDRRAEIDLTRKAGRARKRGIDVETGEEYEASASNEGDPTRHDEARQLFVREADGDVPLITEATAYDEDVEQAVGDTSAREAQLRMRARWRQGLRSTVKIEGTLEEGDVNYKPGWTVLLVNGGWAISGPFRLREVRQNVIRDVAFTSTLIMRGEGFHGGVADKENVEFLVDQLSEQPELAALGAAFARGKRTAELLAAARRFLADPYAGTVAERDAVRTLARLAQNNLRKPAVPSAAEGEGQGDEEPREKFVRDDATGEVTLVVE